MVDPRDRIDLLFCSYFRNHGGGGVGVVSVYRHLVWIQAGLAGLSPDEYERAYHVRPGLQEADIIQPELTGAM